MDEKLVDEILDNLISEAGPKAIEELEKEDLKNLDKKEFEFSKEHEEKMAKLFEEFDKENVKKMKEEVYNSSKTSTTKKLLLVAVITVLILAIAISSVSAWRESFVKYFLSQKEEYSDLNVINKNLNRNGKDFWVDNIHFGYIPEGYELEEHRISKKKTIIWFKNNEYTISLEIESDNLNPNINTENSTVDEVQIADKDAVYCENGLFKYLTWNENSKSYILCTNDSKDILIKIAQKIQFVK